MSRLPVEKLSIYALLTIIGTMVADLGLMSLRGEMYPQQPPPPMPVMRPLQPLGGGSYNGIKDRNIFNSDGKIAAALGESGVNDPKQVEDPEPIPSTLQLTLLGTIVHANPARSIASIALKSKNEQVAVKVNDVIPDELATVISVERSKLVFRNKATSRREYIEMKDESKINFGAAQKIVQQGEVTILNDNTREIKRGDIDKLTSNLPELLQQARAVPRMGAGGAIECFSLADIAPGSIYERLGLKRGDCIKSVNGEQINSPAKAMELYNALRSNANTINLGIERAGRDDNFQYNILQ